MIDELDSDLSQITNNVVLIPAAGVGKRFGGHLPKQYCKIKDRMVLDITLDKFLSLESVDLVVLIVSPTDEHYQSLSSITSDKLVLIDGGEDRSNSVNNGLRFLFDNGLPDETPILVHDAVRPCISDRDIQALLDFYAENKQACFLAEPVNDSLRKVDIYDQVVESVDREQLVKALTPQMSRFIDLKHALATIVKNDFVVTDEVGALINCDIPVSAITAQDLNIKITRQSDLLLAETILSAES
jgi:2-C-methyl-D-erythritol 4-phosphate cytidylyltransferase